MDASSQATGPSNQTQQCGSVTSVTNREPSKKGRWKLNRAIFDVDTAAALRINAQAISQIAEAQNPPLPEVIAPQETTGTVHPPDSLLEGPLEGVPVGHIVEEQLHAQSKYVSCWGYWSIVSQLTRAGAY